MFIIKKDTLCVKYPVSVQREKLSSPHPTHVITLKITSVKHTERRCVWEWMFVCCLCIRDIEWWNSFSKSKGMDTKALRHNAEWCWVNADGRSSCRCAGIDCICCKFSLLNQFCCTFSYWNTACLRGCLHKGILNKMLSCVLIYWRPKD